MRIGNSMDRARHRLQKDLRAVAKDTEALLEATSGETSRRVVDARQRAQDSLDRMRARFADEEWLEPARRAAKAGDEFVHDHPWSLIGTVAVVGIVIGLLLRGDRY